MESTVSPEKSTTVTRPGEVELGLETRDRVLGGLASGANRADRADDRAILVTAANGGEDGGEG